MPRGGTKHDTGKPSITLIPAKALYETAKAFGYGAKKYGKYNFKNGLAWTRLLDAALRHILAFSDGEDFDKESRCLHLGNAMANLAMLLDQYENKKSLDDRYRPKKKRSKAKPKKKRSKAKRGVR